MIPNSDDSTPSAGSLDQRNRILTAVIDVVTERGYADATAVEIILRARISSKTFYKHFPSKEAAFRAALRLHAEAVLTVTDQASQSATTWPDRVYASLAQLVNFILTNPLIARMGIVELQTAGPQAIAEFQRWLRRYADSLAPHPGESSAVTTPRTGVSDQIAGGISQLLYDSLTNHDQHQLTHILPDIVEIALAPYMGPRHAAAFVAQRPKPLLPPSFGHPSPLT